MENIDKELLSKIVGDYFVDAGAFAMKFLGNDNLLEMIEKTAEFYLSHYSKGLYSFFPNHFLTQPGFSKKDKINGTLNYFKALLAEEGGKEGTCRLTSKKGKIFPVARDKFPLGSSSIFVNFNPCFQKGLWVAKEIIIRLFFYPLVCVQSGKYMTLVQSANMDFYEAILHKNYQLNLQAENGPYKLRQSELIGNTLRCLRIAKENKIDTIDSNLTIIFFTNYNQGPFLRNYDYDPLILDLINRGSNVGIYTKPAMKEIRKFIKSWLYYDEKDLY